MAMNGISSALAIWQHKNKAWLGMGMRSDYEKTAMSGGR